MQISKKLRNDLNFVQQFASGAKPADNSLIPWWEFSKILAGQKKTFEMDIEEELNNGKRLSFSQWVEMTITFYVHGKSFFEILDFAHPNNLKNIDYHTYEFFLPHCLYADASSLLFLQMMISSGRKSLRKIIQKRIRKELAREEVPVSDE